MRLTPAKQQIVDDAVSAGYVREDGESWIGLVKRSKHRKPRVPAGIRLYRDGTAFRLDVDLGVAAGIRSHAAMRAQLGI